MATSRGRQSDPGDPNQPEPAGPERRNGQAKPTEMRWKLPLSRQERVFHISGGLRSTPEYEDGFNSWLRSGRVPSAEQRTVAQDALASPEYRAIQADDQSLGGSMVPSEQFIARLIKFVDDAVFIRQLPTV